MAASIKRLQLGVLRQLVAGDGEAINKNQRAARKQWALLIACWQGFDKQVVEVMLHSTGGRWKLPKD